LREADSEVLGRHVLNGVGLVNDEKIVRVKIARAFLRLRVAPSQHDEKETVVEHHKVRRVHPATGLLVKTARTKAVVSVKLACCLTRPHPRYQQR
jgi:hypothetical protein